MKLSAVSPRTVAEVARIQSQAEFNRKTFKAFRTETLGRLRAVSSILPDDWEVLGWTNEARFVAWDYAPRHNLEY